MLNGDTQIIAYVGYPTSILKFPMVDNSWFVKQDVNAGSPRRQGRWLRPPFPSPRS